MTPGKLTLAVPSKGRLMTAASELFSRAGLPLGREGSDRGYRGSISGLPVLEIAYLSASEIAAGLKSGSIDAGITGEDLLRDTIADVEKTAPVLLRLGFGPADVVVAVPESWLDVASMADLDEVASAFYARHGRRLRIATKYLGLTRRFFRSHGLTGYRIVESSGATEGAPATGTAEAIVDITTTGRTLKANRLKILDDGIILKSEAVLAARSEAAALPVMRELTERLEHAM